MAKVFEGQLSAAGLRFAIIVSRFNSFITERLYQRRDGRADALRRECGSGRHGQGAGLVGGAAGGRASWLGSIATTR